MNLAPTVIASTIGAYNDYGFDSFAQSVCSALIQRQNVVAGQALNVIAKVGSESFLDMVMGAVQGKSLAGTTTESNFVANANAFFGALTPQQLQALQARLLPTDAAGLAAAAMSDVNARAALGALSVVSVQVAPDVAQRFALYDPTTGSGQITSQWITDRSAMTDWLVVSRRLGTDGPITSSMARRTISEALHYEQLNDDGTLPVRLLVGDSTSPLLRRQMIFSGDGADFLYGRDRNDALYAGAGDDTLDGGAGHDRIDCGDGDDFIFGSVAGRIDAPTRSDFSAPAASGQELARGFSWVAYQPTGSSAVFIGGTSGIAPLAGDAGNFIDAGAGHRSRRTPVDPGRPLPLLGVRGG